MRYRLMATYRGVPYEAGVGPSGSDVVLFAACPPPEELGFEPATGHWRKRVIRAEVDALWESRPVGTFRNEPCLVLDDLGDRLHIAYLGADAGLAASLGYWQVDRGVFELLTPRDEVTGLIEERIEKPLRLAPPVGPAATQSSYPYHPGPDLNLGPAPDLGPDPLLPPAPPAPAPRHEPIPDGGGRAARRQRVQTRDIFCELADLAADPADGVRAGNRDRGRVVPAGGPRRVRGLHGDGRRPARGPVVPRRGGRLLLPVRRPRRRGGP